MSTREYMDHEEGKHVLLEVADLLDSLRIPFLLIQGTALGAWRDGGFVPTEKDIDLGILHEHLEGKFSHLLTQLLLAGFDVECFVQPFTVPHTIVAWKGTVKVDLVGLIRWHETNCVDLRFTPQPVRRWIDPPYAIVHESRMLSNLGTVRMFGREFAVPVQTEKYLTLEYGPDWRTPREDHVSRTRIENFLKLVGIPRDYLER